MGDENDSILTNAQGNSSGHHEKHIAVSPIKSGDNGMLTSSCIPPQNKRTSSNEKCSLIANMEDNTRLEDIRSKITQDEDIFRFNTLLEETSTDGFPKKPDNDNTSPEVGYPPPKLDTAEIQVEKFRLTVEPVVFLAMLKLGLESVINGTLLLYKVCHVHFNHSEAECLNVTSAAATSKEVQDMVADYGLYRSFLEVLPGLVISIFAGPWSDIHGRKPIIILPVIGYILTSATYLLATLIPTIPPEFLMLSSFLSGCGGGLTVFMVGCFSYIGDISSSKKRTLRIAVVDLALAASIAIGLAISGPLSTAGGFLAVFLTSLVVIVACLVYVVFLLRESPIRDVATRRSEKCNGIFHDALSTFTTSFKPREGRFRAYMLSTILAASVMVIPFTGEGQIMLLYVSKKFKWDQSQLAIYSAYGICTTVVGATVLFRFVFRRLKVPDLIIAFIGIVGFVVKALFTALSTTGWLLYVGATVAFFQPLALPVVRSILTKLIRRDEQGKIFAFMASCESAVPLFSGIVYTQLYKATVDSFPGAAFLFTASVMIVPIICFSWIYADMRGKKLTFNEIAERIEQQQCTTLPLPENEISGVPVHINE